MWPPRQRRRHIQRGDAALDHVEALRPVLRELGGGVVGRVHPQAKRQAPQVGLHGHAGKRDAAKARRGPDLGAVAGREHVTLRVVALGRSDLGARAGGRAAGVEAGLAVNVFLRIVRPPVCGVGQNARARQIDAQAVHQHQAGRVVVDRRRVVRSGGEGALSRHPRPHQGDREATRQRQPRRQSRHRHAHRNQPPHHALASAPSAARSGPRMSRQGCRCPVPFTTAPACHSRRESVICRGTPARAIASSTRCSSEHTTRCGSRPRLPSSPLLDPRERVICLFLLVSGSPLPSPGGGWG